jgi:hypothetical protein
MRATEAQRQPHGNQISEIARCEQRHGTAILMKRLLSYLAGLTLAPLLASADSTVSGPITFGTGTGLLVAGSRVSVGAPVNLTGNPSFSIKPAGSPFATLSMESIEGTAAVSSGTVSEFLLTCGLTSSVGPLSNKVCGYFGTVGIAGSGNIWSVNTLSEARTGFFGATHVMQGIEVDNNNKDKDVLAVAQPTGIVAPYAVGVNISSLLRNGVTTFYNTAALATSGSWQFGVGVFGDIAQTAFYEHVASPIGADLAGTHSIALRVMNSPTSFDAIHAKDQRVLIRGKQTLSTGSAISSTNSANNAFVPLEIQAAEIHMTNGPLTVGAATGAAASAGDVNIHGLFKVDGVAGVTCTVPVAGATITIKAGIVTAFTGC